MEYYSVIKGTRVLSNEVDEPRDITQSDVSQKEQDKYRILMHIYGIQKDGTDETICRAAIDTDIEKRAMDTAGGVGRRVR